MLPSEIKRIFQDGQKTSVTSTIASDFMPLRASGSIVSGALAEYVYEGHFIDFCSSAGCNALGYNNFAVKRAVIEQLNSGVWQFCSNDWHNEPAVALKKKLCGIAPVKKHDKIVFLSSSGTEAVEAAIKLCMARCKRPNFIAFEGAFHGRTLGSLALNRSKEIHTRGFPRAFPVRHLPFPEKNNPEAIARFNESLEHADLFLEVNAIILELVQGEGGINVISKDSLNKLLDVCWVNGVSVIVDEVQTGLMRTGKMFACEHYGIQPDIICLAKALGGGLPLGATITHKEFDFAPGQHSNTNGGNPLACAASLATIDALEKMDKIALEEKIKALAEMAPEGLGMMRRIKFPSQHARDCAIEELLRKNLLVIGAGERAIRLMPPLNIPMQDLQQGIEIIKSVLV